MGLCAVRRSDIKDPVILRALVERAGQGTYKLENTGKEVIRMPRGDGTGPMGFGPMTGRAAGYCAGYPVPGFMNPMGGGVAGMAYGYGAGPYMSAPGAYGYGMPAYGAGYGMGYAGRPYGGFGPRSVVMAKLSQLQKQEMKRRCLQCQEVMELDRVDSVR